MASRTSGKVFRTPAEGEKLVPSLNTFALDMYKNIMSSEEDNLFLSPASISMALGMTSLGAGNNTLKQMADALFNHVAAEHQHEALSDLQRALNSNTDCTLHVANRLYGQHGFGFLETFLEATRTHYDAELKTVNFANEQEARQEINGWVEQQTADKIKDLIPEGVLDALTHLVLVNAIYFKGDWLNKFEKEDTKRTYFYINPSRKVKVNMMHHNRDFMFGQSKELKAKALELPYKGNKLSMVVLLPDDKYGLAELETQLTSEHLNCLSTSFNMAESETVVSLPRFKLHGAFSLKDTLSAVGMSDMFDPDEADFSAMVGGEGLYVDKVLHKAFINVDEEGSEAAAATAVETTRRCLPTIMEFNADHPFLFMIRENETGTILFVGRMVDPGVDPSGDEA